MKKLYIRILLVLCPCSTAFAQQTINQKDYVVIKSDTIDGFLQTSNFEGTPSKINFRRTEADPYTTYLPSDINAFSVSGTSFEARTVSIDLTSTKLTDVMSNASQHVVADTVVFLKVKLKSPLIMLYEHVDLNDQVHFFIQKGFAKPDELLKKCSSVDASITCRNLYWQTLHIYLGDCPSISDDQIKNNELKFDDLKKLLNKYLKCKGSAADNKVEQSEQNNHKLVTSFYVAPGICNLFFANYRTVGGTRLNELSNARFGSVFSIQAGLSFDDIRKLNPRFVLGADIGIKSYSAQSDVTSHQPFSIYTDHTIYDMTPTYIRVNPSMRYIFAKSGLRPYIRIGVSVNYAFNFSSSYSLVETTTAGTVTTDSSPALTKDDFQKIEFSYLLGIGLRRSRIGGEIRTEGGTGLLQTLEYYHSTTQTTSFYIAYQITKF